MIRSRSYAVPLTAVLLALATGIALGAGPLTDTRSAPRRRRDGDARAPDAGVRRRPSRRRSRRGSTPTGCRAAPSRSSRCPGADPATVTALTAQIKAAGGQVAGDVRRQGQLVDAEQKSLVDTLGHPARQAARAATDRPEARRRTRGSASCVARRRRQPRRRRRPSRRRRRRRCARAWPRPSCSTRPERRPADRAAGAGRARRAGRPGDRRRVRSPGSPPAPRGVVAVAPDPRRRPGRPRRRRRHQSRHDRRRQRDERRPGGRRAGLIAVLDDAGRRLRCVGFGRPGPARVGWNPVKQAPVTKHVFVTGGVASSLGKGLTASSLGQPSQLARTPRHDAEARPLPQRRPRDDEPVPARRGLRHRRRRRDRPRHRPLRAVPRPRPRPAAPTSRPGRSTPA